MQLIDRRHLWPLRRKHLGDLGHVSTLGEITRRTSGHHIFPRRVPTFRARNNMIKGQVIIGATVLAHELVTQEYIEPCEGWCARGLHIGLE